MRSWHRACAPFFALLLAIVAITGIVTRIVQTIDHGPAARNMAQARPALVGPCKPDRPKRSPLGEFGHTVKGIHSGEVLGPVGVALNLLCGIALCFFAVSGFWMYLQMWLRRRRR